MLRKAKFYLLTALTVGSVCLFCLSIWAFLQAYHYAFDGQTSVAHNFGEFEPPSTKSLITQAMWLKMASLIIDNSIVTVLLPALVAMPIMKIWRKRKSPISESQ